VKCGGVRRPALQTCDADDPVPQACV